MSEGLGSAILPRLEKQETILRIRTRDWRTATALAVSGRCAFQVRRYGALGRPFTRQARTLAGLAVISLGPCPLLPSATPHSAHGTP